ncbi:MAG: tetratricopeptide repeat protein [Pseudomonadaceae bacterium]|nr:tetratricopeptide repeat protein [Pseudomonadaceae bacterium]
MKVLLVWLLLALVLGGLVGMLAGRDPGYVLIAYGDSAIETSLWAGIVVLVFAYIVVRALFWLFSRLLAGRVRFRNWSGSRRERLSSKRTVDGMVALADGDWKSAGRLLVDAAPHSTTPFVNYLGAARAAHQLADYEGRDALLGQARESTPGSRQAVDLRQAEFQFASGQTEQALATGLHVLSGSPKHPGALAVVKQCYLELEEYDKLSDLLPSLRKAKAIDAAEEESLQAKIALAKLAKSPSAETWRALPKSVKSDADVVLTYAQQLLENSEGAAAASVLHNALTAKWDDSLVDLYGAMPSNDPGDQMVHAQRWLKERPNNPRLLLALGRIALKQEQWNQAREYLEASARLRKDPEVAGELGRLCLSQGDEKRGSEYLAQATSLPKLPQPEL